MQYLRKKTVNLNEKITFTGNIFLKYFFGVTCPIWLSFLFSLVFCRQVVHLFHLVFRHSWNSNPHPRTMAWIVSPQHSTLDQGASPRQYLFICLFFVYCPIVLTHQG